jgi:hypothetical protein
MKKLMRYYVISGQTVEEQAGMLPSNADRKKPRGVRRAGASSASKIRSNERSSVRRLARLAACNFGAGDGFVTLKYDGGHYPGSQSPGENVPGSEGYEKAEEILARFLRKLRAAYRRQTGAALRAIWQTANFSPYRQAPARLHHHLLLPRDAVELARSIWQDFGGQGTVIDRDLSSDPDRTRLAEYMATNVQGRTPGQKGWSSSRGLRQPVFSEPEEIGSIEEIRPPAGAVIREVREITDEDGIVIGRYQRYVLPEAPRLRGGQIVMPRPPKRGGRRPC